MSAKILDNKESLLLLEQIVNTLNDILSVIMLIRADQKEILNRMILSQKEKEGSNEPS